MVIRKQYPKKTQYYGKFINKYIYEPIESGSVKERLNKLNIKSDGSRKVRFHQWLSDAGRNILIHQIGRVQGLMEYCLNIEEFKSKAKKRKKISIAPDLLDKINMLN